MLPENLLILNYHKIETHNDIGITTRHPDDFSNDLDILKSEGFTPLTFNDLRTPISAYKPVIITFDDAYQSFLSAANTLLKNAVKAVVFVPTAYIGQFNDWDVQVGVKKYKHLSARELRQMDNEGFELGSHTCTHRFLNHLNDAEIHTELQQSKSFLEKIIKREILTLSYPFGKVNNRVTAISKKYYKYGVTLFNKPFGNVSTNPLTLPRINIYRTDTEKTFLKKLSWFSNTGVTFLNWAIQQGAWATILLHKLSGQNKQNRQ